VVFAHIQNFQEGLSQTATFTLTTTASSDVLKILIHLESFEGNLNSGSETLTVSGPNPGGGTVTKTIRSSGVLPFIEYQFVAIVAPGTYTVTVTSSLADSGTQSFFYVEGLSSTNSPPVNHNPKP
jgi:hypothetical protein